MDDDLYIADDDERITDEEMESFASILDPDENGCITEAGREFLAPFLEGDMPGNFVTVLNVQKYKRMVSTIAKIKGFIDGYLAEWGIGDRSTEYSFRYQNSKSVRLTEDVSFGVRLPREDDIEINVSRLSDILSEMDGEDEVAILSRLDGRLDLVFTFVKVRNLVSSG